ncbi:transposase [Planctomycetota bacterium]
MPACARRELVRDGEVGTHHCISRCVRRAFLCGEDHLTGRSYEHRKKWIRSRLEELAGIFAAEVCGYSVLGNHLHVVVRVRPDWAADWDSEELATRWWRLCPKRRDGAGRPQEPTAEDLGEILGARAGGDERLQELCSRLSSLSWFMRCLLEPIARRANREDRCTGRFWEGRFKSQALLDERAMLACAVYVDLNPIRAGIAETPETSEFTSAKDRIDARQVQKKLEAVRGQPAVSTRSVAKAMVEVQHVQKRARWLCPVGAESEYLPSVELDEYLELLDWTGRQVVSDKRGKIPAPLCPILERLSLDVDRWLEIVLNFGSWFRRVAGAVESIREEAVRAGRKWLHGLARARWAFGSV